jgi:hypothetical protein
MIGGVAHSWADSLFKPVQAALEFSGQADEEHLVASFSVPAGKRLLIKMATILAEVPQGEAVFLVIETTVRGKEVRHYLTLEEKWIDPVNLPGNPLVTFAGVHNVQIFADPGTTADVIVKRFSGCSNGGCPAPVEYSGSISGCLVDKWFTP